ncbi:MAG TPA: phosphatase PAP2 family protein [Bacteroidetes bacterium]|nr:phosphatase PAP2 family protein [Bacteroidota bacterium]
MINYLKELDKKIFILIHHDGENSFFNFIMPFVRDKYFWTPLYIVFLILIFYHFKKKSWIIIFAVTLLITITDQLSSSVFKPIFHRLRPCQNSELSAYMNHVIDCGSGFGFVSSHAANHFALAVFIGLLFYSRIKWLLFVLLAWAALVCYAQVYVGYHYPADVICGGIVGTIPSVLLYRYLKKRLTKTN